MIPFLLAIAGGYLIAQSRKQDTFADGGKIKYPKYHGSPYDRGNADSYYDRPKDPHYYPEGAYQGERITNLTEEELAAYNAGYDENFAKKDWGEFAKGGKMANGMMADEDEMVYNYVKIKNYPTFQTEEEAKKFIKIGKPFLRKELKEGKIVLVHNGKEYYLAYVKEKMADGAMMERGGKIHNLIMQQNELDPKGYTLVDYDEEKKEWYWEDYKGDTYSSGFKSRKDAYEDLNEYLFKDTEYRYEGKEGTMGQKWPDLPTPTKPHSFREYAKGGKVGTYVMTDDTYVNIFLSRGFYEKRGSMGLRYFEHLPTKVFITYDPKGFQTPVIISTDKTGEETIYEGNSIREVKESLDKLGIVTKKEGVYPTKFK